LRQYSAHGTPSKPETRARALSDTEAKESVMAVTCPVCGA
jgi:hypothetical protein